MACRSRPVYTCVNVRASMRASRKRQGAPRERSCRQRTLRRALTSQRGRGTKGPGTGRTSGPRSRCSVLAAASGNGTEAAAMKRRSQTAGQRAEDSCNATPSGRDVCVQSGRCDYTDVRAKLRKRTEDGPSRRAGAFSNLAPKDSERAGSANRLHSCVAASQAVPGSSCRAHSAGDAEATQQGTAPSVLCNCSICWVRYATLDCHLS